MLNTYTLQYSSQKEWPILLDGHCMPTFRFQSATVEGLMKYLTKGQASGDNLPCLPREVSSSPRHISLCVHQTQKAHVSITR